MTYKLTMQQHFIIELAIGWQFGSDCRTTPCTGSRRILSVSTPKSVVARRRLTSVIHYEEALYQDCMHL